MPDILGTVENWDTASLPQQQPLKSRLSHTFRVIPVGQHRFIRGVVAAEMIEQVVLVEAVLEDEILLYAPFQIATRGPTGDVALSDDKAGFLEGGDNIFVGDAVVE